MESKVITRIWHGRTRDDRADEYLEFLKETAPGDYKSVSGCLKVEIWREMEGDVCHFWTVTKWDGIDSIKQFAGDDYEKAKYYPEDERYLLEFETTVRHCETFEF